MFTRRRSRRGLAGAVAVFAVAVAGCSPTGSVVDRNAGGTETGAYRPFYAVYPGSVDSGNVSYAALTATMTASGAKQVILSAITARPKTGADQKLKADIPVACEPAWGYFPDYFNTLKTSVQEWITDVGAANVTISFGANLDPQEGIPRYYLEEKCADATALQAAYQSLIDDYKVTSFDFNIEGGIRSSTNAASNAKRVAAMKGLIAANPTKTIKIGFTVEKDGKYPTPYTKPDGTTAWRPEPTDGANDWELGNVKSFADAGILPSWVNLMVLHTDGLVQQYGPYTPVTSSQAYMSAMVGELTRTYLAGKMTQAEIEKIAGFTTSNNEAGGKLPFTVTDAKDLYAAASKTYGYFSPWIVNQDYPCSGASPAHSADFCSSTVPQSDSGKWAFSKAFTGR